MIRLSRPHFNVRRLMVVVAIAGLILGGVVWSLKMWRLSREYMAKSNEYELRYDANPGSPPRVRQWEGEMMLKYRGLSFQPWRNPGIDPPEPQ